MSKYINSFLPQKNTAVVDDIGNLIEPDKVPFKFDTIGWKVLISMILLVSIFLIIRSIKKYIQNTYRRNALRELCDFDISKNNQQNELVVNFANTLLKKTAILVYGRPTVANLHGAQWTQFLDSKTKHINFKEIENLFSNASYMSENIAYEDRVKIVNLTKKWIQTHA